MIPVWMMFLLFCLSAFSAPIGKQGEMVRIKQLKDYIRREKPAFEERKKIRKNTLEELDRLNANQNEVRKKMSVIAQNHGELSMALENLMVDFEKQKQMEGIHKQKLNSLLKMAYRIKRDGIFKFLIHGGGMGEIDERVRILFWTLRSHSLTSKKLEHRAKSLEENEKKIVKARNEERLLWEEIRQQESILKEYLTKKKELLKAVTEEQENYKTMLREYKGTSRQIHSLFRKFEQDRGVTDSILPRRQSLKLPVENGKIVKSFGRNIHERFSTVTYQKGIEIESEHNSPVYAVLPGIVEFEGWVKGLGNVVIIHHGEGFYSLNAQLFASKMREGTRVQAGDVIGFVGDTGNSDRPGLYFELRENGKAVDPLMYFSSKELNKLIM